MTRNVRNPSQKRKVVPQRGCCARYHADVANNDVKREANICQYWAVYWPLAVALFLSVETKSNLSRLHVRPTDRSNPNNKYKHRVFANMLYDAKNEPQSRH